MSFLQQSGGYQVPPALREVLTTDPVGNRWAGFDAAMAYARAGFRVLPIERGGKAPERRGPFQHGALSATSDVEAVRDAFVFDPDVNVGTAGDPWFVMFDIDERHGGSLEAAERVGVPVTGYRECSGGGGWHIPAVMPPGTRAIRSVTIAPGVEVKAYGSYVVAPHSRLADGGRYRVEPGRDVWTWPAIPANWTMLSRLTEVRTPGTSTMAVLLEDRREADRIMRRLREHSAYRETVAQIVNGAWKARYPTRSEADAALALLASHFLRGHERRREVLFALLGRHSLKAASHSDPDQYLMITINAALAERDRRDTAHVDDLADIIDRSLTDVPATAPPIIPPPIDNGRVVWQNAARFSLPSTPVPPAPGRSQAPIPTDAQTAHPTPPPPLVNDPTLWGRRGKRAGLVREILAFAGSPYPDAYSQPEGWRRLPVNHMQARHDASAEAVRRAQVNLTNAGLIERAPRPKRHDGGPRMDARIRITNSGREALDAIRNATDGEGRR